MKKQLTVLGIVLSGSLLATSAFATDYKFSCPSLSAVNTILDGNCNINNGATFQTANSSWKLYCVVQGSYKPPGKVSALTLVSWSSNARSVHNIPIPASQVACNYHADVGNVTTVQAVSTSFTASYPKSQAWTSVPRQDRYVCDSSDNISTCQWGS